MDADASGVAERSRSSMDGHTAAAPDVRYAQPGCQNLRIETCPARGGTSKNANSPRHGAAAHNTGQEAPMEYVMPQRIGTRRPLSAGARAFARARSASARNVTLGSASDAILLPGPGAGARLGPTTVPSWLVSEGAAAAFLLSVRSMSSLHPGCSAPDRPNKAAKP
jgi:hypothetical protein